MILKYHQVKKDSLLDTKLFEEGSLYLCTESGSIFYDPVGGSGRVLLGSKGIKILNTENDRLTLTPTNETVYFVIESKKIYSYMNNRWDCYQNGGGPGTEITIDDIIYHTDMLVVNNIGGIKAGDDLNGLSVGQVLTKLIYPYVKPIVSIVAKPNNGGVFEKGNTRNINDVVVSISKKSELIKSIQILNGSSIITTKEDESIKNGGSFTFHVNLPVESKNVQVTTKVTDASKTIVTDYTGAFTFVYPYYTGSTTSDTITESIIKSFTKSVSTKSNKIVSYTTDNAKMVFAYPKSYGTLKKIIDQNNFDVTATFNHTEVNITCLDGTTQAYYVYANKPSTVTNFKMTFNY